MIRSLKQGLVAAALVFSTAVVVADPAPDFTLPLLNDGGKVSLTDLRGKVVYIDFWASWCGPCTVSLPEMNQVREALKDQGFEVIAINLDEKPDDARRFLATNPVSYPVVIDEAKQTPRDYQIPGMPVAFLVDRQGQLRGSHSGFRPGDGERLKTTIEALLKEAP